MKKVSPVAIVVEVKGLDEITPPVNFSDVCRLCNVLRFEIYQPRLHESKDRLNLPQWRLSQKNWMTRNHCGSSSMFEKKEYSSRQVIPRISLKTTRAYWDVEEDYIMCPCRIQPVFPQFYTPELSIHWPHDQQEWHRCHAQGRQRNTNWFKVKILGRKG